MKLTSQFRQPIGMAIGTPAAIAQRIQATLPVTIEDLVAGDSGDTELPTDTRNVLALEQAFKYAAFSRKESLPLS